MVSSPFKVKNRGRKLDRNQLGSVMLIVIVAPLKILDPESRIINRIKNEEQKRNTFPRPNDFRSKSGSKMETRWLDQDHWISALTQLLPSPLIYPPVDLAPGGFLRLESKVREEMLLGRKSRREIFTRIATIFNSQNFCIMLVVIILDGHKCEQVWLVGKIKCGKIKWQELLR